MTEKYFRELIYNYILDDDEVPERARAIAAEFEVATSTVLRWATGTARPHPLIQAQVARWIEDRLLGSES